jgi:hypothetical protein
MTLILTPKMSLNIDRTVTVKCRIAIKALFLYFNLCLSVMLESLYLMTFLVSILMSLKMSIFNDIFGVNINVIKDVYI